jgi:hypothetical protein
VIPRSSLAGLLLAALAAAWFLWHRAHAPDPAEPEADRAAREAEPPPPDVTAGQSEPPAPGAPPAPTPSAPSGPVPETTPGDGKGAPSEVPPGPEVLWRDGETERRSYVDLTLLAEWGGTERVRDLVPGAEAVRSDANFRLWRLPPGEVAKDVVQRLGDTTGVHAVLRDGPLPTDPVRALTGRVAVRFDAAFGEAAVEPWVRARGYEVVRRLSFDPAWWLLAVPSRGLEVLDLVEALVALPEVEDAAPDWWVDRRQR